MPLNDQPPRYQTFILRLWEERLKGDSSSAVWRYSVEDAQTRERWAFVGAEELCAFLEGQIVSVPPGSAK
jgi:hypothetical protein